MDTGVLDCISIRHYLLDLVVEVSEKHFESICSQMSGIWAVFNLVNNLAALAHLLV